MTSNYYIYFHKLNLHYILLYDVQNEFISKLSVVHRSFHKYIYLAVAVGTAAAAAADVRLNCGGPEGGMTARKLGGGGITGCWN